jgi:phospholipase C
MDTRREFLKKASILSAGMGLKSALPESIIKALAINPATGSTYLDAEHVVFLMQENRSFDHAFGTLQGVRGFNDPRAITLPGKNKVWLQSNKEGETYAPFRLDIKDTKATWMSYLPHSWSNQVDARNNGRHDKWLDVKHSGNKEYAGLPLTLGYYNREDIPFYYALADAFTICDQHFCSSLTGTTANRLFFWTGTIREQQNEDSRANVWNQDVDYDQPASWKTFPERLEENNISWKVYQNKISFFYDGMNEEEDGWLGNFGDNPFGYFAQYNVKLSTAYIDLLPQIATLLGNEITDLQQKLTTLTAGDKDADKINNKIESLQKKLVVNAAEQKLYTKEAYEKLSDAEKRLHEKAFSINIKDPFYNQLDSLQYNDGATAREVKIPKGDVLHQFREDVNNGTLPAVSWLVAPENFSDHPASAWYGAWYISEVMDILTKDPELWKKTIFVITYDENDGYFDHVPPFVAPDPRNTATGLVSKGIDTSVDYVSNASQQSSTPDHARESSVGLGYRVPMIVISPWTRGGWVCSQVFDHTSSLQFLEKFISKKFNKEIVETNISRWRRTVCGDLSSVFRPYDGDKITMPSPVEKDSFIESIYNAQFKNLPSGYKKLTAGEIALVNNDPHSSAYMPVQEKGIRSSCALPYELYADGKLSDDNKSFEIIFNVANNIFGDRSAGSPFIVYALETTRTYAVTAGDSLKDSWLLSDFENNVYHLQVYGPNGFYREFIGNSVDPLIEVLCSYEIKLKKPTGNIIVTIKNKTNQTHIVEITDNAYQSSTPTCTLEPANTTNAQRAIVLDTKKNFNWYDFSIKIKDSNSSFERRYAGRVETGTSTKTDPAMGRVL